MNILADAAEVASVAEARFAERLSATVDDQGECHIALAGGSTPKALYQRLSQRRDLPWSRCHLWFGDERWVPPDSAESNYRMVRETLLEPLGENRPPVHPMPTEVLSPDEAAAEYAHSLFSVVSPDEGGWPQFDLVLLGLGADGHTASLFPGATALSIDDRPVAAILVPHIDSWRLTLTPPVLEAAQHTLFLVTGADKSAILGRLHRREALDSPVSQFKFRGRVEWLIDRAAASELDRG